MSWGRQGTEGHCLCSQTWLGPRALGQLLGPPGPTEINPALGVSLCSNKCSGDSDDPSQHQAKH